MLRLEAFGMNTGYEIKSLPEPPAEGKLRLVGFAADGGLRSQRAEDVTLRLELDLGVDLVRVRRWPALRLEL